jgi:hypothetical protein
MTKKIGIQLRYLVLGQSETLMLSRTKCEYRGEIYTFDEPTEDDIELIRLRLIKSLDKKNYLKELLDKLKRT